MVDHRIRSTLISQQAELYAAMMRGKYGISNSIVKDCPRHLHKSYDRYQTITMQQ